MLKGQKHRLINSPETDPRRHGQLLLNNSIALQMAYFTIHPLRVYTSLVFSTVRDTYNRPVNFRTFSSPEREKPIPWSHHPYDPHPLPCPKQPLSYFLSLQVCLFWMLQANGITCYMAFCNWLLSLDTFKIHVPALLCPFLQLCIARLFMHPCILGCFHHSQLILTIQQRKGDLINNGSWSNWKLTGRKQTSASPPTSANHLCLHPRSES